MKRILSYFGITILTILLTWLIVGDIWAKGGSVTDTNDCKKGNILIGTGKNTGGRSIGTWTDIKTIPELKGEKGDTGERGLRGFKGDKGEQGIQGIIGERGIQGIDGKNGLRGYTGKQGVQGVKGYIGNTGKNGHKGDTGNEGEQGIQGIQGLRGIIGKKGDKGALDKEQVQNIDNRINNNTSNINNNKERIDTLEETDVCIVGEVDFIREKNYKVGIYGKYDIRHQEIPEVGLKITVGIGVSWEQRKIEEVEKRIKSLEKKLGYIGIEPILEKTNNGWEMSISEEDTPKVLKRF